MSREIWPESSDSVVVLAPHPDDESLVAGGLLSRAIERNAHVRVIFATDGDNAPWIQRRFEKRWSIGAGDRKRFGELRRAEAARALRELGIGAECTTFLGIPDQGVTAALLSGDRAIVAQLRELLLAARPTLLVAPSMFDRHPDHSAFAVLVRIAMLDWPSDLPRPRELAYLVHGAEGLHARHDNSSAWLSSSERGRKRDSVLHYASQLSMHRRRYLRFASERELFVDDGGELAIDVGHPVREVALDGTNLRVRIELPSGWRALRGSRLSIVAANASGARESFAVPRLRAGAEFDVVRCATGEAIARARCEHKGDGIELATSLGALAGASELFVKLEHRVCFFDTGGWRRAAPSVRSAPRTERKAPFVCAVIPCFNVAGYCTPVIREAARHADLVLAYDDGSTDGTGAKLREIAAASNGRVEVHAAERNGGKGVALLAMFRHALEHVPFDVLITLDGDGQHRPSDIEALAGAWSNGADFVVGARDAFRSMPLRSRIGNTATSAILRRINRACPTDTQSGFRAHDRSFVEEIVLHIRGQRYETESRILMLALRTRRTIASVSIPTVYLDGNRSSHFRPLVDSARILGVLAGQCVEALRASLVRQQG